MGRAEPALNEMKGSLEVKRSEGLLGAKLAYLELGKIDVYDLLGSLLKKEFIGQN